jgi:ectoine hydroxylase-related dioxygenase (phytanoyl-CoA dioxygenase family)
MVYVGNLWHTAGINKTNIPRSVLLSNFSKLEYKALDMWDKNDKNIDKQVNDNDTDFKVINGKVLLR